MLCVLVAEWPVLPLFGKNYLVGLISVCAAFAEGGAGACRSFHTTERALEGIEAMHLLRKGQVKRLSVRDSLGQAKFVESLFVSLH